MQHMLRMGIDVGSTTVKVVLLDEHDNYLYKKYIRHYANILDTVYTLLQEAQVGHEDALVHVCITGSGGMAMAEKVRIPFVQEVIAETRAVKALYPETDVIIELGGEDAKVTYLGQTAEHRMNGSCAGGTGAFIDQMATLLQTDASGLNQLAMNADTIYPIAARCGVFAKTDVQALLNQGASHENIAKSVFQAIVNQTIAGLACGHKIEGNVAFLGGPLTFLSELRQCFCDTLELDEAHRIIPENGELFIALGAALMKDECREITVGQLTKEIGALIGIPMEATDRVDPLFKNEQELEEFRARHAKAVTPKANIEALSDISAVQPLLASYEKMYSDGAGAIRGELLKVNGATDAAVAFFESAVITGRIDNKSDGASGSNEKPATKQVKTRWLDSKGNVLSPDETGSDYKGEKDISGYKLREARVDNGVKTYVYDKTSEKTVWVDNTGARLKADADGTMPDKNGDAIPGYTLVKSETRNENGNKVTVNVYTKNASGTNVEKPLTNNDTYWFDGNGNELKTSVKGQTLPDDDGKVDVPGYKLLKAFTVTEGLATVKENVIIRPPNYYQCGGIKSPL